LFCKLFSVLFSCFHLSKKEQENGMFREAKQAWHIERPARNTIGGFRAHVYLTLATMALTRAFRKWMDIQDKKTCKEKIPALYFLRLTLMQH